MTAPRVVVLADDLIWSTRLVAQVWAAGAEPIPVKTLEGLRSKLVDSDAVIVDLTALHYDGVAAIREAVAAGRRLVAVGQHDDVDLRRRALDAGAERVYAYRKLFQDGPATLASWLSPSVRR